MDEPAVGANVKGDEALPDFRGPETGEEHQGLAALADPSYGTGSAHLCPFERKHQIENDIYHVGKSA
jgi:hypothetical protein